MAPNPEARPRIFPNNRWKPPKRLGNNWKWPATTYYHDGQTTIVGTLPRTAQRYKQYSVYHDHAYIWAVDLDASLEKVGDGRDDSADRVEADVERQVGEVDNHDWATLTFHELSRYRSYAGLHLESQHLHLRNETQIWPEQILPDTYRATQSTPVQGYGGLVGELPLLIGLMALALPSNFVQTGLPSCMANPWRVYPVSQIARTAGWEHRRGLVVSVYYDTNTTTTPVDLYHYERGTDGSSILP
ncbi:hypothetical protein LTR48_001270 [Friedmanniomyces endolithicus]|uniref:Amine oxidase n=1 Tax=Rachicladosporium monterosium TaxID=1507873 RepID=A0ABR0LCE0_9PEZI|nr:hypothetical protein LTR29_004439 [Friedmanniomyces endolithicus]KAK1088749.1 hypothetical protein LTR48_001270 [Friedmanniomyces endolithicus]KAK5146724.1 hypothetical protein LTR32_001740 [Rachicladosporium monterosium]